MQIGDPKKALVLTAVAIVILAVAAFQLMPKGIKKATVQTISDVAHSINPPEPAAAKSSETLPSTIVSDPFARLPDTKPKTPDDKKAPTGESPANKGGHPTDMANTRGQVPFSPLRDTLGNVTVDPAHPGEITGNDQKLVHKSDKTSIDLNAILKVDHRIALVGVDGVDRKFKVGDTIGKDIQIVELTDSKMTLMKGTMKKTLTVGGNAHL